MMSDAVVSASDVKPKTTVCMMKKRSQIRLALLAGLALVLLFSACAGSRESRPQEDAEEFVWPLPPEQPRIRFVRSIHSELDVGQEKSLARKISEKIFGRSALRALRKPLAVHVDKQGRILVVDTGWHKVLIFDFANKRLEILGKKGSGRLLNPIGVTTDEQDRIYVTDAGGGRIMVYTPEGKFLHAFGGKTVLLRPAGIVINSELNRLYVVDTWAHQIKVFDKESGAFLFAIGRNEPAPDGDHAEVTGGALDQIWNRGSDPGEFRFPTFIAMDENGTLYVVDTLNFRVQIFSPEGKFIATFGEVGNMPGNMYRPKGISLDSDGHIYVADAAFSNIQIFDKDGRLLLNFGTFGSGTADMRLPADLYITKDDQIYVVDQFNHRIQVFEYLGAQQPGEKKPVTVK